MQDQGRVDPKKAKKLRKKAQSGQVMSRAVAAECLAAGISVCAVFIGIHHVYMHYTYALLAYSTFG